MKKKINIDVRLPDDKSTGWEMDDYFFFVYGRMFITYISFPSHGSSKQFGLKFLYEVTKNRMRFTFIALNGFRQYPPITCAHAAVSFLDILVGNTILQRYQALMFWGFLHKRLSYLYTLHNSPQNWSEFVIRIQVFMDQWFLLFMKYNKIALIP